MLKPASLVQLAPGTELPVSAASWPEARGVTFSTERLRPGDVFFALPGASSHGIRWADAALAQGASFIVSDRPHPRGLLTADPEALLLELGRQARARLRGRVVGVTGSVGKTSMKDLLACLLAARSTPGNLNTTGALACTLVDAALADDGRDLVLELGIDHRGEMTRLLELTRPDAGVLTAIALSHSEFLGDLDQIAAEKRLLLDHAQLRFAASQTVPFLRPLPDGLVSYGVAQDATVSSQRAGDRLLVAGAAFPLTQPGSPWATNLTGAVATARALGTPTAVMQERLAAFEPAPQRLQLKQAGSRTIIDDSYNSNPASAAAAIEVLRESAAPLAAVLGDMRELGPDSREHHRQLGRATVGLDVVIAVGEYAGQVREGNPAALTAADTEAALELLSELPATGTVLVKASRSLRFERIVDHLGVTA